MKAEQVPNFFPLTWEFPVRRGHLDKTADFPTLAEIHRFTDWSPVITGIEATTPPFSAVRTGDIQRVLRRLTIELTIGDKVFLRVPLALTFAWPGTSAFTLGRMGRARARSRGTLVRKGPVLQ